MPLAVLYSLMPTICPDCTQNLDHVPLNNPCPQCGSTRRSTHVFAETAVLAVTAVTDIGVKIGYRLAPGWTYQWHRIQRHLARLREQYQGVGMLSNMDVEETVHALFLDLCHLQDWLFNDSDLSLGKRTVETFVKHHADSLGLCEDYANTRKHMVRKYRGERVAQITSIESRPKGQTATIGYLPWDQPDTTSMIEVDALALAQQSERDWRVFLTDKQIPIPPD